MAKRHYKWPPKPKKLKYKHGAQLSGDGDAFVISLKRQRNDRSVRGAEHNTCCDCGLTHLNLYEVFQGPTGNYFLTKRAYRLGKQRGKKIILD